MTKLISLLLALFIFCQAKTQTADTTRNTSNTRTITEDTTVYEQSAVDSFAHFKGGNDAWVQFLGHNMRMDVAVRNGAGKGSYEAVAKFVVTKSGKIKNIVPQTTIGYGTEEELKRILKASPKWVPATIKGQPVNSYLTQKVIFVVSI